MRKTKIICTIGPASSSEEMIVTGGPVTGQSGTTNTIRIETL